MTGEAKKRIVEAAQKKAKELLIKLQAYISTGPTTNKRFGCMNATRDEITFGDGTKGSLTVIGNPPECCSVDRIGPNSYVAIGPLPNQITIDGGGYKGRLLIATGGQDEQLNVRKLEDPPDVFYRILDMPEPELTNSGTYYMAMGIFRGPSPCWTGPKFSPTGKHIFIPSFAFPTDPPGSIRFRILKNIALVDNDGDRVVTCEEIIDKVFTFSYDYVSAAPMCDHPGDPVFNLTTVTDQWTPESDSTTVWEAETDSLVNTLFNSDVRIYEFGYIAGINPLTPPVYDLRTVLDGSFELPIHFQFYEDSNGDPIVDFYCQYYSIRQSHKNYRVVSWSSSDPNNTGFMPFSRGSFYNFAGTFNPPSHDGDQTKYKIISTDGRNGYSSSPSLPDGTGRPIYNTGKGDGTPPTATPVADWDRRYLRHNNSKDASAIIASNHDGTDSTTNIGLPTINVGGTVAWLNIAAKLRVYNIHAKTNPPTPNRPTPDGSGNTVPPYPLPSTISWNIPQNWTSYTKLYFWLKQVSVPGGVDFYIRLNPNTSPIDILIPHTITSTTDWKLIELDISGISVVNEITFVYDDGSAPDLEEVPPSYPSYTSYRIWVDGLMALAKEVFNPPVYGDAAYLDVSNLYTSEQLADGDPRFPFFGTWTLIRDVTFGSGVYTEDWGGYTAWSDLASRSTRATNEIYRFYAGAFCGQYTATDSLADDVWESNSGGNTFYHYTRVANYAARRGFAKISNMHTGSPTMTAWLFEQDNDEKSQITASAISDEEGMDAYSVTQTAPGNSGSFWPDDYFLFGVYYNPRTAKDAGVTWKDFSSYQYYSPFDEATPEEKGDWVEGQGDYGPYFTEELYGTNFSEVAPEGFQFVKPVDTYKYQIAFNDETDPDNPKGVVEEVVWNPETEEFRSVRKRAEGELLGPYTIMDWIVK